MTITILGVNITTLKKNEIMDRIQNLFSLKKQIFVVTPNPEMLVLAFRDHEFRAILNSADLALPDGVGLKLAAHCRKEKIPARITGTDFVLDLAVWAQKNNLTVYLFGGRHGAGESTKKFLEQRFLGIDIETDEEQFVNNQKKKYVVFVALGHGQQERVAQKLLNQHPNIVLTMGVGGAFDFLGGKISRAPKLMRYLGLEWLFRLLIQPWRIKRIWIATAVFMYLVLKQKYAIRRS